MRLKTSWLIEHVNAAEAKLVFIGGSARAGAVDGLGGFAQLLERAGRSTCVADDAAIHDNVADPLAGRGVDIVAFIADKADVVPASIENVPAQDGRVPFAAGIIDEEWFVRVNRKST